MAVKYCSECFNPVTDMKKFIRHNNWNYCGAECLNERINVELQCAWLFFKNHIDIYNNEEPLGSLTLLA